VNFFILVLSTNHDVGHKSTNRLEAACMVTSFGNKIFKNTSLFFLTIFRKIAIDKIICLVHSVRDSGL